MSGDVVARARESLLDVEGYGGWVHSAGDDLYAESGLHYAVDSSGGSRIGEFADRGDAQFAIAARSLVPELVSEVERLRGENLTLHESAVHWRGLWQQNTATASAAIAERDAADAEVEKLRGAIETIRGVASTRAIGACARGHRGYERAFLDILAVIERAGIEP